MRIKLTERYITHLDSIIKSYDTALRKAKEDGAKTLPDMISQGLVARIEDITIQATGQNSPYTRRILSILHEEWSVSYQAELLVGIVKELKKALKSGYLTDLQGAVAGEVFDDLLEMALYLHNESCYLPAAAVAGAILEDSLRRLYRKNITIIKQANKEYQGDSSIGKFNDALKSVSVYPQPQWRLIQGWADIRNHAVHGNDMNLIKPDLIKNMIDGIRSFLANYPA